jgi:hypothetical protein
VFRLQRRARVVCRRRPLHCRIMRRSTRRARGVLCHGSVLPSKLCEVFMLQRRRARVGYRRSWRWDRPVAPARRCFVRCRCHSRCPGPAPGSACGNQLRLTLLLLLRCCPSSGCCDLPCSCASSCCSSSFLATGSCPAPRTWPCFGSRDAPASSVAAFRCTAASCAVPLDGPAACSDMASCYPALLARSLSCPASAPAPAAAVVCFWTGPSHPPAAASFPVAAAVAAPAPHPAPLVCIRCASRC